VAPDLVVNTQAPKVLAGRKFVITLLLASCPEAAEIKTLAAENGIVPEDESTLDIVGKYLLQEAPRPEHSKCILCGLCVRVCAEVTERHALSFAARGSDRKVKTPFEKIADKCIGCGSCAYVCPTHTITVEEAE
jgi:predicted molibdopterin-dependent oxidoreductase YjgC